MKKLTYLAVPVVCLAFVALSCGQVAPTAQNEVVLQQDDQASLPPIVGPTFSPDGHVDCCPEVFNVVFEVGNPADRNGDNLVCQKDTPGGTLTIDNNDNGNCDTPCIPPC